MKEEKQRSTNRQISECKHFKKLMNNKHQTFLAHIKPQIKGWVCVYDGCCKKSGSHSAVRSQLAKFSEDHKIFLQMNTLQLFCFQCNIEITDQSQQKAYDIRKLAMNKQSQNSGLLFGANKQYPQGFHQQKAGLAGTIGNELTQYTNAAIQFLAHLPPFYQICQEIDIGKCRQQYLAEIIKCINTIQSGVYRIVQLHDMQRLLIEKNKNFLKYSFKTPNNVIYQILRGFSQQYQYIGEVSQKNKQKLDEQPVQQNNIKIAKYGPIKQMFTGQFIWFTQCQVCQLSKIQSINFQCLRLQIQNQSTASVAKLQQLIQSAFDFEKLFQKTFTQQQVICTQTQKCIKYQVVANNCKIKLPNILLLQFVGVDGLKVDLPQEVDLAKCTKHRIHNDKPNQKYDFKYVGSISRTQKKYVTHATQNKQRISKKYIFENFQIKADVAHPQRSLLAVYKLESKNKNLSKNIQSSINVNVQCYVPLPDFWHIYLAHLYKIQPLVNPFICEHGYIAPQILFKAKAQIKIPISIYEYLVQQFGGTKIKIKKDNHLCQHCQKKIHLMNELKQSQKQIAKFAGQLSSKKSKACIDLQWFQKWKKYLYDTYQTPYRNGGFRRPGPIDNKKGLNKNGQIDQDKYKKISPEVWYFFKKFYGGGPMIAKNLTEPSLALKQAVDLRYEKIKQILNQLKEL